MHSLAIFDSQNNPESFSKINRSGTSTDAFWSSLCVSDHVPTIISEFAFQTVVEHFFLLQMCYPGVGSTFWYNMYCLGWVVCVKRIPTPLCSPSTRRRVKKARSNCKLCINNLQSWNAAWICLLKLSTVVRNKLDYKFDSCRQLEHFTYIFFLFFSIFSWKSRKCIC